MALNVEWVRYGRDANERLRATIATAKAGEPLNPVTVVVPSNHVGVSTRRLLGSGSLGPVVPGTAGVAGVTFLTPYRLAELTGAPTLAATGRRPVSTPVVAAALREVLARAPGVFAPVADHPSTEAALVAAYRELRDVTDAGLDLLAKCGRRAHDVVTIHRGARALLEPDWYDEQDLMTAATVALDDPARAGALGAVMVHLPQRVSRYAGAMLAAVAQRTDVTVIAGITGHGDADAEVLESVRRIVPDVPMPALAPDLGEVVSADGTTVILASDADDETRAAARAVVDAARAGTPLDRIAVLHAGHEPYARLVHEHLVAAGVAVNGPAITSLSSRVAGRLLLDLMGLPGRGFRRQDVFAWLNAAPVRHAGRWAPAVAWERISRDAGVVAGRAQWDEQLERYAADLDARADAADDPDQPAWKAERLRADAERTRALRDFVLALIDDLAAAASSPRRWSEHASWARGHLERLLGPASRRGGWPADEAKAADRVDAAFDRLASLDAVEEAVTLDVFARTLALELDNDLGRVGRFGEGVFVGPITMGLGLDLDLVVLLGLTEGTYPAPVRDDSLLPDHERRVAGSDLALRAARVGRQHRELLAALAAAPRQVLGVPRGDLRRSNEKLPSRWVLDVVATLDESLRTAEALADAAAPWLRAVPSFAGGLRHLSFPATEQEHRLRRLMADAPSGPGSLQRVADDEHLALAAEVVDARRSPGFTRFDGNLAGTAVPSPVATITSATRLEGWAACPFDYFLETVLGVGIVENPEDALQITPLDLGTLVHEVLERFIEEVLERPESERPAPGASWTPADHARIVAIGEEVCDEFEARGVTGRPVFWHRDRARILRDLDRFLAEDDRRRSEGAATPVAAELGFGMHDAAVDAVVFTLPDGRTLRFRGKADRVDRASDASLRVVDYKTGSHSRFTSLSAEDPDRCGTKLQLPVYAAAARLHAGEPDARVHAEYWFVTSKGGWRRIGYEVTDAVADRFATVLGVIVDGIEGGIFCAHPGATTTPWVECPACDPDGLGAGELRRAWERKRGDPALTPYTRLAEPDAVVDAEEADDA